MRIGEGYPFPRSGISLSFATISSFSNQIMLPARRVSLLNPGNNRPLPQNVWDVIERSG